MLELALSLFDYLIKFLEKREANIDEYFSLYIQPAYDVAEKVFADYWELLHSIRRMILIGNNIDELINFLEDGRTKYQPLRIRLRTEIKERFKYEYLTELPLFERGILGILMGGVAPFNDERRNYTVYIHGEHTLLDLTRVFHSYYKEGEKRENYLRTIDEQMNALEAAWNDVVKGYAEYKLIVVPSLSKPKKKS